MYVLYSITASHCKYTPSMMSASCVSHQKYRVFLPAADIPSFVGKGNVDLGITGHDVILEAKMENLVTETLRLDFGKCALQVQVPENSPIKTVEDLAGRRIVTSFEVLAGEYFQALDHRLHIAPQDPTKIEYVGGSVEAACALGLADGIGEDFTHRSYHCTT
jgi:ATP phosphoribosyltransferase